MKFVNKLKKRVLLAAAAIFVGGTAIAETQLDFLLKENDLEIQQLTIDFMKKKDL